MHVISVKKRKQMIEKMTKRQPKPQQDLMNESYIINRMASCHGPNLILLSMFIIPRYMSERDKFFTSKLQSLKDNRTLSTIDLLVSLLNTSTFLM